MMKLFHKENYKHYMIALLSLIVAVIAYPFLPEQIPVHFNAQGVVDNYGSPLMVFLFPVLLFGICILAEVSKHADPKASNYALFSKHYYLFFLVVDLFLLLVHLYIISYSLDLFTFNISTLMTVLVGVLFIVMGNMMPKIKHNYFMGIKTPWTLANEQVWFDTHRFCGKLWFVLGIIVCICGFLSSSLFVSILLCIILAGVLIPFIYSYVIFKRINHKESNTENKPEE